VCRPVLKKRARLSNREGLEKVCEPRWSQDERSHVGDGLRRDLDAEKRAVRKYSFKTIPLVNPFFAGIGSGKFREWFL
jgi:hypothetical protein